MTRVLTIEEMTNLALSAPEAGSASFVALHRVLKGLVSILNLNDTRIQTTDQQTQLMFVVDELLRQVQQQVDVDPVRHHNSKVDKSDDESRWSHSGTGDHSLGLVMPALVTSEEGRVKCWKWDEQQSNSIFSGGRLNSGSPPLHYVSESKEVFQASAEEEQNVLKTEMMGNRVPDDANKKSDEWLFKAAGETGKAETRKRTRTGSIPRGGAGKDDDQNEEMASDEEKANDDEENQRRKNGKDKDRRSRGAEGGARGNGASPGKVNFNEFISNVIDVADIENDFFKETLQPEKGHLMTGADGLIERVVEILKEEFCDDLPMCTLYPNATEATFNSCIQVVMPSQPAVFLVPNVDGLSDDISGRLTRFIEYIVTKRLNIQIVCSSTRMEDVSPNLRNLLTLQHICGSTARQVVVTKLEEIRPGDQVAFPAAHIPRAQHHGIVKEVKDRRRLQLIHHNVPPDHPWYMCASSKSDASIRMDVIDMQKHVKNGTLMIVKHSNADIIGNPDDIVKRAESQMGEIGLKGQRYHILKNNCETFANWCVTGKGFSSQTGFYF